VPRRRGRTRHPRRPAMRSGSSSHPSRPWTSRHTTGRWR
jgi:hypothetical protein